MKPWQTVSLVSDPITECPPFACCGVERKRVANPLPIYHLATVAQLAAQRGAFRVHETSSTMPKFGCMFGWHSERMCGRLYGHALPSLCIGICAKRHGWVQHLQCEQHGLYHLCDHFVKSCLHLLYPYDAELFGKDARNGNGQDCAERTSGADRAGKISIALARRRDQRLQQCRQPFFRRGRRNLLFVRHG